MVVIFPLIYFSPTQGLLPGTSYRVRVVAQGEEGAGASSDVITVRTQAEVELPLPPANLTARPTSAFSILVTWDSAEAEKNEITQYKLYHRRVSLMIMMKMMIMMMTMIMRSPSTSSTTDG